jgi:hypothetical protein
VAVAGDPAESGRPELVKTGGPAHVGLLGPNTVNVTVPVGVGAGAAPPVTVATSETVAGSSAVAVAWVASIATGAGATTDLSF